MQADELAELNAKRICHECIGERYLSDEVASTGQIEQCNYCEQQAAS